MKLMRILISIIFIIVVGSWTVNKILYITVKDHTAPVITSDRETLELSVKDEKEKLLDLSLIHISEPTRPY